MNILKKSLLAFSLLPIVVAAQTKSRFEELELFNKILYLIESQYYRDVDSTKLIEGAIRGMMDALDPHSTFLNKEYYKKMQNETEGEFGGLGIEVTVKDGQIYVVTPIDDTPAFKAGIKAKDKIIQINHESILGMSLTEAIDKMKGKEGTKIHLGIQREGAKEIKHFTLKREIIKINPVKFELVDDSYAFIRLTQFQRKAAKSVEEALKKLSKQSKSGIKGIILDLRSNPGGLLDEAVDLSSLFLNDGVVVSTESRDPNNKDIRYVKKSGFKDLNTPIVVLVNGSSASASEIVSGALQDHKRAIIMGTRTFGKGSVQTVAKIDNDNGVKLTIAQYMTPSGKKIQAIGIKPDIEINEFEAGWLEAHQSTRDYIREKDLRNHLTATIETKEEKSAREEMEREEASKKKAREEQKISKKKDKDEEEIFKKYEAKSDYQVQQAINFLKSFKVFKEINNPKV